jgi:DNA polymerase-3 subunit epsilon
MNRNTFLKSVTVLDTETTNLHAEQAEIVEIAGARYDGKNWIVKDALLGAVNSIPPEASAKTRISNRMIANKPKFVDSLDLVDDLLHTNNTTYFVAHNCQYDQTVLAKSWLEAGQNQLAEIANDKSRWICTYRLAKQLMEVSFTDMQYSLSYLRYKLDLPVDDAAVAHRAGDDTLVCAVLFEFLVDYALATEQATDEPDLGEQIHNICWRPLVYKTWPFGKNKGKEFHEIPNDYYLWALKNLDALNEDRPDFNYDLSESVRVELERRLEE